MKVWRPLLAASVVLSASAVLAGGTSSATTLKLPAAHLIGGAGYGDGGPAIDARLSQDGITGQVALDPQGGLLFADPDANEIRRINNNTITRFAGNGSYANPSGGFSGDAGPATSAALAHPTGLAVASDGSIYVADSGNFRIRKIATNGTITTYAGTGTDNPASTTTTPLTKVPVSPQQLAVDSSGDLFFTESGATYSDIREISAAGHVSTVVGRTSDESGTVVACPSDPTVAVGQCLPAITSIAVDDAGDVYFGAGSQLFDANAGVLSIVAGQPSSFANSGDGGPASGATIDGPYGLAFDATGQLLIAADHEVRALTATGDIIKDRSVSGAAAAGPLVPDGTNVDTFPGGEIDQIDATGATSVLAGAPTTGTGDGLPAVDATFTAVTNTASMPNKDTLVGDAVGRVWTIDLTGKASRVAGSVTGATFSGEGGPARAAVLPPITNVAAGPDNSIYIGDSDGTIRKVATTGSITTIAGNGTIGAPTLNGSTHATDSPLDPPGWIAVASDGTIYFTDPAQGEVISINGQGVLHLVAGNGSASGRTTAGLDANKLDLGAIQNISLGHNGTILIVAGPVAGAAYDYTIGDGFVESVTSGGAYAAYSGSNLVVGASDQLDLARSQGNGNVLSTYADAGAATSHVFGSTGDGNAAYAPLRAAPTDPPFDPVWEVPLTGLAGAPAAPTGVHAGWDANGPYVAYAGTTKPNIVFFGQLINGAGNTPASFLDGGNLQPRTTGANSLSLHTDDPTLGAVAADGSVTVSVYAKSLSTGAISPPITISFVPRVPTLCSIQPTPSAMLTYGKKVTITSLLTSLGTKLANQPFTLTATSGGKSTTLESGNTNAVGAFVTLQAPASTTKYTLSHKAGAGYGSLSACSGVLTVSVASIIKDTVRPATIRTDRSATVTASVSPNEQGQSVALQQLAHNKWRTFAIGHLNRTSHAVFTVKSMVSGSMKLRVVKAADANHAAAAGNIVTVTVKK